MMRLARMLPLLWLTAYLPTAQAQTLHVVLAADTSNAYAEFAEMCKADLLAMRTETTEMAKGAGLALDRIEVAGADFTSEKLKAAIASVRAASGDVVLFYYSGAAYCATSDPVDQARTLQMGKGGKDETSTVALVEAIQVKQARLNIILVDACAKLRQVRAIPTSRGDAVNKVYRSLFSACGTVLAFSSRCPEYSYGTRKGSIFTNAFIGAIDHFISIGSQTMTWKALLDWAGNTTTQQGVSILVVQHPVGFFEGWREGCVP